MKKAFAAAAALAAMILLVSCSGKDENKTTLTPEQEIASIESERATTEDLSELAAGRDAVMDEIGKTVQNEKLVVCITRSNWYEYEVYRFKKNGMIDYKLIYYFYNTKHDYENGLQDIKTNFKDLQKKDKDLLLLVDKYKDCLQTDFADYYEFAKNMEDDRRVVVE